jgi:predicted ATPase
MAEASTQLKKGLALLTSLPDSVSRRRQELELQIALGRVLIATQGYAASAVGDAYARARALCEQLDRPSHIVPVIYGQGVHYLLRGPLHTAQEVAADLLQLGEATGNAALTNVGHGLSATTYFQLGEFQTSHSHSEKALAEFDPKDRPFYMSLAAQDRKVTHLAFLSCGLFCLGHFDQARLRSEAAIEEARTLDHPFSLAHALSMGWLVDWATRSREKLRERSDEVIAICEEHGFRYFQVWGICQRGWGLSDGGKTAEGLALLGDGVAQYRATGSLVFLPFALTLLADAEGKAGRRDQGLGHLVEAERLVVATGDRFAEAELHRIRGELLLATDDTAAERCFHQAIGIAQRQDAKCWELRAVIALARLRSEQGKRDAARNLLEPIYKWFTEGLDTPLLKEAKALLAEL